MVALLGRITTVSPMNSSTPVMMPPVRSRATPSAECVPPPNTTCRDTAVAAVAGQCRQCELVTPGFLCQGNIADSARVTLATLQQTCRRDCWLLSCCSSTFFPSFSRSQSTPHHQVLLLHCVTPHPITANHTHNQEGDDKQAHGCVQAELVGQVAAECPHCCCCHNHQDV